MGKIVVVLPAIILLCFYTSAADDNSTLRFVHVLFHHGARAPLLLYPTDPNPESAWPEGLGQLTKLGKQQQYSLGKYFHSRYASFAEFSPNKVEVYSTSDDLCIKSAATNLASFFKPNEDWQIDPELPWQPITIRYKEFVDDELLSETICPLADEERTKVELSPQAMAYAQQHSDMFHNLTYYSGILIDDGLSLFILHDTIFVERLHNQTTPPWIEPWWDELESVSDKFFNFLFATQELQRLRAGPLLKDMVDRMMKKIKGDLPDQKFQVYSGHDTNVAVLLLALGVYNDVAPPFASSVLLELHALPEGVDAVRLLYLNSTRPEVEVLHLTGCGEFCPLERFLDIVGPFIPQDVGRECMMSSDMMAALGMFP